MTNQSYALARERRNQRYIDNHGSIPLCACGCGNTVNIRSNNKPSTFLKGHGTVQATPEQIRQRSETFKQHHNFKMSRNPQWVPIEDFRDDVRRLLMLRGLTIKDAAEFLDLPYVKLKNSLHSSRLRFVQLGFRNEVVNKLREFNSIDYHRNAYRQSLDRRAERAKIVAKEHFEAYVAEHGHPTCECGCGELVSYDCKSGKPYRFVGNHAAPIVGALSAKKIADTKRERAIERGDYTIEDFATRIKQIKEKQGLSWTQLSKKAGFSDNYLASIVFNKKKQFVRRENADRIFKRLLGIPTVATQKDWDDAMAVRWKEVAIEHSYGIRGESPRAYRERLRREGKLKQDVGSHE